MLCLASVGPKIELKRRLWGFNLPASERLLLGNLRSGVGSLSVCKIDREAKIVYPTDVMSMNSTEIPEGYCLSAEFIWAKTVVGEDLLFPGNCSYGLMEKERLVDTCRAMNTAKKHRLYIVDDEKPRMVYMVDRVTLSDDGCIEIAAKFDQRFPIYGFMTGNNLTRVVYQSEWLVGEDLAVWRVGIDNVIWSPMAKLLFHL